MSSIWNNNIALFCKRFPALAQSCGVTPTTPEPRLLAGLELLVAKNGQQTAKDCGKLWHSHYNPLREAEQAISATRESHTYACAFFSCGLGYAPVAYAKKFPHDTLIIVEPNCDYFFAALTALDWSPVFSARNIIFALQAGVDTVVTLLENAGGFAHTAIIANQNQMLHATDYFSALSDAIDRAKRKAQVNTNTLERFSSLWLRNSCRNIRQLGLLDGIVRYQNKCPENLDALILAAGPTLDAVLPYLTELKKRTILICVDTALRACLRVGVEPDFVLLVDPQYYAARHLAGLAAPSSVLITESAAYPSVYRFACKEIVLCASLFPLGKYFERQLGSKGELAAGGSVSTTAWDFARLIGAQRIFMAGLDLGYPNLQTHIRGSTAEEKIHTISLRTKPAETMGIAALFGANMVQATDYDGNPLLTDDRMQLFGWWFENKMLEYPTIKTYTLSAKSLAIPHVSVAEVQTLLCLPERTAEREQFFSDAQHSCARPAEESFAAVYDAFVAGFDSLYQLARRGIACAKKGLADRQQYNAYMQTLAAIDAQILHSEFKEIAALVFPTERQLQAIFASSDLSEDMVVASFQRSHIIYKTLQKGINAYRKYLNIA